MATTYKEIINRFLPTVAEYMLADLDEDTCTEIITPYIISATTQFGDACIEDIVTMSDDGTGFATTLSDEVIEIIVDLMRVEWFKHKIYNSEALRNGMSTKDYTVFSPANLLEQLLATYNDAREEARMRLYQYTYTHPKSKISEFGI